MKQAARFWFAVGAVAMLLAVAIGAFGAHGIQSSVTPQRLASFETGVRYHFYHALGLFAVAFLAQIAVPSRWITIAGSLMTAGIVLFSGAIYLLVLTDTRWLGAIAPIGGTALMLAWGAAAVAACRR